MKALNDYRQLLSVPEETSEVPAETQPKPAISDFKLNDLKEILGGKNFDESYQLGYLNRKNRTWACA